MPWYGNKAREEAIFRSFANCDRELIMLPPIQTNLELDYTRKVSRMVIRLFTKCFFEYPERLEIKNVRWV